MLLSQFCRQGKNARHERGRALATRRAAGTLLVCGSFLQHRRQPRGGGRRQEAAEKRREEKRRRRGEETEPASTHNKRQKRLQDLEPWKLGRGSIVLGVEKKAGAHSAAQAVFSAKALGISSTASREGASVALERASKGGPALSLASPSIYLLFIYFVVPCCRPSPGAEQARPAPHSAAHASAQVHGYVHTQLSTE